MLIFLSLTVFRARTKLRKGPPIRATPLPGSCPLVKDKAGPHPRPTMEEPEPEDLATPLLIALLLRPLPGKGPWGPPAETPSKHADHQATVLGTLRSWTSQPGPAHGTATVTIDLGGSWKPEAAFGRQECSEQFLPMARGPVLVAKLQAEGTEVGVPTVPSLKVKMPVQHTEQERPDRGGSQCRARLVWTRQMRVPLLFLGAWPWAPLGQAQLGVLQLQNRAPSNRVMQRELGALSPSWPTLPYRGSLPPAKRSEWVPGPSCPSNFSLPPTPPDVTATLAGVTTITPALH